jgi:DNA-directed RNA polymerase alpha subunit
MNIEILTRSQIVEIVRENVLRIIAQEVKKATAEAARKLVMSIPKEGTHILAPSDSISELGLGVRASNLLWVANISTIEKLTAKTERELRNMRAMGMHTLMDIKMRLALHGYALREEGSNTVIFNVKEGEE